MIYPRPPLTEAVIELRFGSTLSARDLERCRDRLKRYYGTVEDITTFEFKFEGQAVSHKKMPVGYKMIAPNAVDVLMLNTQTIGTVRLAPYTGWEKLLDLAKENFETFTKIVGRLQVVRLGARAINRIDIPSERLADASLSDYVRIAASLPAPLSTKIGAYFVNAHTVHEATGAKLIIQSGLMAPTLLEHTSVNVDVDAFFESEIPQRLDDMWEKIEQLRTAKNSVFESVITDKTRELFQ